jgi:hypothetical protein
MVPETPDLDRKHQTKCVSALTCASVQQKLATMQLSSFTYPSHSAPQIELENHNEKKCHRTKD